MPESFKVLVKELQSLGLDIRVLDAEGAEIDLKQTFDDDDEIGLIEPDSEAFTMVADERDFDGYSTGDIDDMDGADDYDDADYSDDDEI